MAGPLIGIRRECEAASTSGGVHAPFSRRSCTRLAMLSVNMSVAHPRPRCVTLLDDFLELAIRDLEAALDEISISAAVLDAQLARDPSQDAVRTLARELGAQAQYVARVRESVVEGDRQWC